MTYPISIQMNENANLEDFLQVTKAHFVALGFKNISIEFAGADEYVATVDGEDYYIDFFATHIRIER
jgi:hypothetical protein